MYKSVTVIEETAEVVINTPLFGSKVTPEGVIKNIFEYDAGVVGFILLYIYYSASLGYGFAGGIGDVLLRVDTICAIF